MEQLKIWVLVCNIYVLYMFGGTAFAGFLLFAGACYLVLSKTDISPGALGFAICLFLCMCSGFLRK